VEKSCVKIMTERVWHGRPKVEKECTRTAVRNIFSIVLSNVGVVAEVCPGELIKPCNNGYWTEEKKRDLTGYLLPKVIRHKCKLCHGTGVIARKGE